MTTAIAFSAYGPPDVLEVMTVAEPHPGPGQVRVRVKAAGVQPFDAHLRRGDFRRWVPVHFPQTLGNEFAGVIDEVGDGVSKFDGGSAVIGFTEMGAYAEVVVVDADAIVAKPPAMPWEAD